MLKFLGSNARKAVNSAKAQYIPVFLNDSPRLYRRGVIKPDMVLINLSAPDELGIRSMGPAVESVLGAIEVADVVVGKIVFKCCPNFLT